ncbi:pyridoxamine 5'-phosphate oxidase family protein [Edaphobacter aggregans]|uniref:pyridoxamine 5'-phosphate oxidase family protein n=1 Tax=Edaphobacter aggregans TaxID=570835 RepID=UPI0012FC931C
MSLYVHTDQRIFIDEVIINDKIFSSCQACDSLTVACSPPGRGEKDFWSNPGAEMNEAPAKLTADMKRVVAEQRLAFVATVCPDGTPNLSPKGTIASLGRRSPRLRRYSLS